MESGKGIRVEGNINILGNLSYFLQLKPIINGDYWNGISCSKNSIVSFNYVNVTGTSGDAFKLSDVNNANFNNVYINGISGNGISWESSQVFGKAIFQFLTVGVLEQGNKAVVMETK